MLLFVNLNHHLIVLIRNSNYAELRFERFDLSALQLFFLNACTTIVPKRFHFDFYAILLQSK